MNETPRTTRLRTVGGTLLAGGLLLGAVGGIGTIYLIRTPGKTGAPPADLASCEASVIKAEKLAVVATGEVAAMKINRKPKPLTDVSFFSHDGKPLKIGDFSGKLVLMNLWATWCAPCRAEMPALDRLQEELGGKDFEVVAINIDTTRLDRPKSFLKEVGVKHLAYYQDQSATIFTDLKKAGKAFGMPTTLLIDKNGCELGVMAGPAEWSSPDATYLIKTALGR